MVSLIGFMIGAYILVRMIEIIVNKDVHGAVVIAALITFAVVSLCLIVLLSEGYKAMANNIDIPSLPHNLEIPHSN